MATCWTKHVSWISGNVFCAEKISRTRRLVLLSVTLTFSLPSGCHMTLLTKCFPSAYTGHRLLDTFLPDNVIFSFLRIVWWNKVPKSRISGKLYLLSRVFQLWRRKQHQQCKIVGSERVNILWTGTSGRVIEDDNAWSWTVNLPCSFQ